MLSSEVLGTDKPVVAPEKNADEAKLGVWSH